MHVCDCYVCVTGVPIRPLPEDFDSLPIFGQTKNPSNEDGTVTLPIADSEPKTSVSNVSVNFDNEDDAGNIAELFIALGNVFGPELAADFLFAMATCPPDEQIKLEIGSEKRDGSTRKYDPASDVRQWHEATGDKKYSEVDQDGKDALIALRRTMIAEEEAEIWDELTFLSEGSGRASMEKLAKELADMLYVVYGTADLLEINLPAVFQLVHANNLTKVNPATGQVNRRNDGKIEKPKGFHELTVEEIQAVLDGLRAL